MQRTLITIDEAKCDGCGQCVTACAEGALAIVDGKAKLVSEVYCDGLGACLGHCPRGAIRTEVREAPDFDQGAVDEHLKRLGRPAAAHAAPAPQAWHHHHGGGCPGSALRSLRPQPAAPRGQGPDPACACAQDGGEPGHAPGGPAGASALASWPVQLALVPPHAPFLKGADLLVCADCVPFAYPDFHRDWLQGRVVLVGCPKLDNLPAYGQKLAAIFAAARPRSVTVLRMEVPCCGGIAKAAQMAATAAGRQSSVNIKVIGIEDGSEV
jgi:Pyruvate/2-oxoacid:ferredoxin oxidoreductase delta subunit